jgi:NADP-dependent 3-hydroxy acid dehydrogenase YdfG
MTNRPTIFFNINMMPIKTIMTNLTGAVITINTCLADMIERKSGHVVGISSVAGYK